MWLFPSDGRCGRYNENRLVVRRVIENLQAGAGKMMPRNLEIVLRVSGKILKVSSVKYIQSFDEIGDVATTLQVLIPEEEVSVGGGSSKTEGLDQDRVVVMAQRLSRLKSILSVSWPIIHARVMLARVMSLFPPPTSL